MAMIFTEEEDGGLTDQTIALYEAAQILAERLSGYFSEDTGRKQYILQL